MAKLILSRRIAASPEAVFAYVEDFSNYHWMFRTPRLSWTSPHHQVGSKLVMELKVAGVPVLVEFGTTDIEPNMCIAGVLIPGAHGAWQWRIESVGAATNLTLNVKYELPMDVLGRIADRLAVERGLRSDLNWTMDHIKKYVELQSRAA